MIDLSNVVPPPSDNEVKISPWIDEQIWGHRLWDASSSWLVFLEFLTVAESCYRQGVLLDEGGEFSLSKFKPYKRMYLRNILFNNQDMERIADHLPNSSSAWDEWLKWMRDKAQGVSSSEFAYLRGRFHSFKQFASLVAMIRSANVEANANKRWTSRFIFPFGPKALYEDIKVSNSGAPTRDYINFGRTGELLYLMLCRCSSAAALRDPIAAMFSRENPWNDLLGLMQPDEEEDLSLRGKSYLPYKTHPTFDRLGEDWLRVFKLALPGFDGWPQLVTLAALHIVLYQLNVANEWSNSSKRLFLVFEVIAPKKTPVRELSSASFSENNLLPARAVDTYLDQVESCEEWQNAIVEPGSFVKCRQILQDRVRWGEAADDYDGPNDPVAMIRELRSQALTGHRQHVANVHRSYGREAGLVSKRGTNKFRYAPTDALFRALVLANVSQRMELKEFLDRLYQRYGFVFGEREAGRVLNAEESDKKVFEANSRRLEQRLASLGMLLRLSDGCAYVENPYSRGSE